jgi:tRNA(Ile)-lysidine synthase
LVSYPLSLKKWHHGDAIYPIGMTGSKKISQLFKDKKLSLLDKEKIWLLCDAKDTIIWVIGLRQDRRFTVNKTTKNRLKISFIS